MEFNHIIKVYTRLGIDPNEAEVYNGTLAVETLADG